MAHLGFENEAKMDKGMVEIFAFRDCIVWDINTSPLYARINGNKTELTCHSCGRRTAAPHSSTLCGYSPKLLPI